MKTDIFAGVIVMGMFWATIVYTLHTESECKKIAIVHNMSLPEIAKLCRL